jgi:hypothetical protein
MNIFAKKMTFLYFLTVFFKTQLISSLIFHFYVISNKKGVPDRIRSRTPYKTLKRTPLFSYLQGLNITFVCARSGPTEKIDNGIPVS